LARTRERCFRTVGVELLNVRKSQIVKQLARQRERTCFMCGLELNRFQDAAQRRPNLKKTRRGGRARLGPNHDAPGGDCREYLIENACALPLMRAAPRELQQIRNVPDEFLGNGNFLCGLANAALELPEPYLPRHKIRAARLEYVPALAAQPAREYPQERGLAHEGLSRKQERSRHALPQRGCRR
jgi:hypothetical protein